MIDVAAFVDLIALAVPFFVLFGFVWSPKTWTPGELVTAASMNTNIRDHLNETLRSQTSTSTGTQNDFALDGPFAYLKLNNASALTITGALVDSGNIDGSRVIFEAINAAVTLSHQSSSSASANRFINDTGADILLAAGERAFLFYDTANTRWRVGKASTGAIAQTIGAINLHPDPYVIIWPGGDAVAPAGATLTKDGNSAIDRDTTTYLYGGMAPELTLGDTATVSTKLTWAIFSSLPVSWRGKTIGIGVKVRSATADLAYLEVDDGGTDGDTQSAYHGGGDAWDWISFTHTITADATKLDFSLIADVAAQDASPVTAFFDGITITEGPAPPTDTKPAPLGEGTLYFPIAGEISTGTDVFRFPPGKPLVVKNVSLHIVTAPTGAALIVDVNHWDGAAYTSMFGATKPQVAAAASPPVGGRDTDGTYRYRCFAGGNDTDAIADRILNVDIDQVGSTVKGSDLVIVAHILQYHDPLADQK